MYSINGQGFQTRTLATTTNTTCLAGWGFDRPDDQSNTIIRESGTFNNLSIKIITNPVTSASTVTFRKNSADTSLAVSIPSTTTGLFEDLVHFVSVAAADTVNLRWVPGDATNVMVSSQMHTYFQTSNQVTTGNNTVTIMQNDDDNDITGASLTYYKSICGANGTAMPTNENTCKRRFNTRGGTLKFLQIVVLYNNRPNSTTIRTRKNGANGNMSISVPTVTTGSFEDTVNTDTVAADDDINYSMTMGSITADSLDVYHWTCVFYTTDNYSFEIGGDTDPTDATVAANLTEYYGITSLFGRYGPTEYNHQHVIRDNVQFSDMLFRVFSNSLTAATTMTLRKNGANGNMSISVAGGSTGVFTSTGGVVDEFTTGDLIAFKLVTGATGTSIEPTQLSVWMGIPQLPPATNYYAFV